MAKKEHQVRCENCKHLYLGGTDFRVENKWHRNFQRGTNYCCWGPNKFPDEIHGSTRGCPMNGWFEPIRWCGTCGALVQTDAGCARRINEGCEHPEYCHWVIHPDLEADMK